ncbi:MAG: hypothetical protein ACOYT8_04400 [Candidatus Dependentiae bacterium]
MILRHFRLIFTLLFIPVLCSAAQSSILFPQAMTFEKAKQLIKEKYESEQLECAFDIHKVILNGSLKKQLNLLTNDPARYKLFSFLTSLSLLKHASAGLAQMILRPLAGGFIQIPELTIEKFIEPIQEKDPELVRLLISMANSLELDTHVAGIIEQLAEKQIPLRVASNINYVVFEHLKKQLSQEKNNVFSLFTKNTQNLEGKVVKSGGVSKPDQRFFEEYANEYNKDNNKLFIFIDDKKENVQAAIKQGSFIGIVFKNAHQLKSDLIKLGVLP